MLHAFGIGSIQKDDVVTPFEVLHIMPASKLKIVTTHGNVN